MPARPVEFADIVGSATADITDIHTHARGPLGKLPITLRTPPATFPRRFTLPPPPGGAMLGPPTCNKGSPAMMMALAAMHDLPCILVPGGVTLPPIEGEDAGKVQSLGARFAHGAIA